MFTDHIALALRVLVFYPLAGALAALPFVGFDVEAGRLIIDLTPASVVLAGLIWAAISGGTFAWSRWAKALGGAT